MHMVISVVVEAHDVESAVSAAESFFNNNLHYEDGGPFDYCQPMVEGHTVAGADRWIDYQDKECAFPLTSDPGQAEIEDSWEYTKNALESNVDEMLDAMKDCSSKEDFMEKLLEDEGLLRHNIMHIGAYQDTDHYLYVQGWSSGGIRSYRGWNYLQEKIEEAEKHDENRWWVVPLDVHY